MRNSTLMNLALSQFLLYLKNKKLSRRPREFCSHNYGLNHFNKWFSQFPTLALSRSGCGSGLTFLSWKLPIYFISIVTITYIPDLSSFGILCYAILRIYIKERSIWTVKFVQIQQTLVPTQLFLRNITSVRIADS